MPPRRRPASTSSPRWTGSVTSPATAMTRPYRRGVSADERIGERHENPRRGHDRGATTACTHDATPDEETTMTQAIRVTDLDHVVLNVADVERSLRFYVDELGLEP